MKEVFIAKRLHHNTLHVTIELLHILTSNVSLS